MKSRILIKFIIFALIMSFLGNNVSAKKILFYDIGTGGYSSTSGYSKFTSYLKANGYDVSSLSRGTLTRETLQNYDILIMQNFAGTLRTEELSAIIWFVMQKGGGLFIDGGSPAGMNQLSILFGITVDDAFLIDTSDSIANNNYNFVVDRFIEYPTMRSVIRGVRSIGFYQGYGLYVTGNVNIIATGDADTYSETQSFRVGDRPPIAAALLFGNGLVFVITDPDFLLDTHIDEEGFTNRQFGLNIVDWLSISGRAQQPGNTTQELNIIIGDLKLENERYKRQVEQLTTEKDALMLQNDELGSELLDVKTELEKLKSEKIGPFTKTNWAIIIVGICIVIATFIISKRRKVIPTMGEETLAELGYEIEEGKPGESTDLGVDESELNIK